MKSALLIAANFIREQRWPIFVLLLWVLLFAFGGMILDAQRDREDLLFIFKQVAVYVVAFSVFFGASAISSDRRSRRILGVLSKAVSRSQYLSGLILGVTGASAIYCFSLGVAGTWTLKPSGFPAAEVWLLMIALLAASMLASTIALAFSTFLNTFVAAAVTAAVLGVPALAARALGERWEYLVPVYALVSSLLNVTYDQPTPSLWFAILFALAETVVFWAIAARIFARIDIAVPVE